jgi:hypothetical protein
MFAQVKSTPLGDITIKEFSVEEARTCDYVFLAVDGDFAKEYAMKITEVMHDLYAIYWYNNLLTNVHAQSSLCSSSILAMQ